MANPLERTTGSALDRLAAANRSARICAAATWTTKRLHRTREDFGTILDWAKGETPSDRASAASSGRQRSPPAQRAWPPASMSFSSSSGGATFTVKAAGAKARQVNVQCTVRTNAQWGRFQVYISTNCNLSLATSSGPFAVDGAGPTSFQILGCIGGFGDCGTFRIYDLVSSSGLVYEVTVVNN